MDLLFGLIMIVAIKDRLIMANYSVYAVYVVYVVSLQKLFVVETFIIWIMVVHTFKEKETALIESIVDDTITIINNKWKNQIWKELCIVVVKFCNGCTEIYEKRFVSCIFEQIVR